MPRWLAVSALVLLCATAGCETASALRAGQAERPDRSAGSLTASASVEVSGPTGAPAEYSVDLVFTVTNDAAGPLDAIRLSASLTDRSGTAPNLAIDCDDPRFAPWPPEPGYLGPLQLAPGSSAYCDTTLTLPAGNYVAMLAASGYSAGPWFLPLNGRDTPPSPAGSLDPYAWWRPVFAKARIVFQLPEPVVQPPQPSIKPAATPTSPKTIPAALPAAPPPSSPTPAPAPHPSRSTVPGPHPRSSLLHAGLSLADAPRPAMPQVPAPLFVLIMVLPAVAGGAAVLSRNR